MFEALRIYLSLAVGHLFTLRLSPIVIECRALYYYRCKYPRCSDCSDLNCWQGTQTFLIATTKRSEYLDAFITFEAGILCKYSVSGVWLRLWQCGWPFIAV